MSTDAIRTSLDQDCTLTAAKYDVIVVGSLVVDVSCHYTPIQGSAITAQPTPASSNPATIRQGTGGVAYNIALALHYLGHKPLLMSVVADDAAGALLLNQIKTDGLSAEGILLLPSSSDVRTGQYVGTYDASKEFIFGMADVSLMAITPKLADISTWLSHITTNLPKAIVLDLCFPSSVLTAITSLSQQHNIPLILEPVSAPLASKLIHNPTLTNTINVFPRSPYTLITPNESELIALHDTFTASNHPSILSSSRYRRIAEATARTHTLLQASSWPNDFKELASKAIALLPIFPTIILTLAERGCLFCSLTHEDTDSLPGLANKLDSGSVTTADTTDTESGVNGGMRKRACVVKVEHYPPKRMLKSDEIKSVNGCGDSFVAGWVAAMLGQQAGSGKEEDAIRQKVGVAQRAASLTLRCEGSVSGELRGFGLWLKENGMENQQSDVVKEPEVRSPVERQRDMGAKAEAESERQPGGVLQMQPRSRGESEDDQRPGTSHKVEGEVN